MWQSPIPVPSAWKDVQSPRKGTKGLQKRNVVTHMTTTEMTVDAVGVIVA